MAQRRADRRAAAGDWQWRGGVCRAVGDFHNDGAAAGDRADLDGADGRDWRALAAPARMARAHSWPAGIVLLNLEGNLRANPLGAAAMIFAALSWSLDRR